METLKSLSSQNYKNWECLIVDDGSTNNTLALIEQYAKKENRIKLYFRPKNVPKGANACRNYGLMLAKGKYINWLDSDDIMHPKKLELQVKLLESNDFDFSICKSEVFENEITNSIGPLSKEIKTSTPFLSFLKKEIIWLTSVPLFKKSILVDNNLIFDESLHAAQEWELFSRVLYNSENYGVIDKDLLFIRKHDNSLSGELNLEKQWYYYLARKKIQKLYNQKFDDSTKYYFKRYFIEKFKLFLRHSDKSKALKIWFQSIIFKNRYSFKEQLRSTLALLSFALSKKGEYFLKKL